MIGAEAPDSHAPAPLWAPVPWADRRDTFDEQEKCAGREADLRGVYEARVVNVLQEPILQNLKGIVGAIRFFRV